MPVMLPSPCRPDGGRELFGAINTGVTLRAEPGDVNDLAELHEPQFA